MALYIYIDIDMIECNLIVVVLYHIITNSSCYTMYVHCLLLYIYIIFIVYVYILYIYLYWLVMVSASIKIMK